MAQFTLDGIRSAAEAKYGDVQIDMGEHGFCTLLNALQMPKERRNALDALQTEMQREPAEGEEAPDQEALMADMLRAVAEDPASIETLLGLIGDNLAVLSEVAETYAKATQAGEASASAA